MLQTRIEGGRELTDGVKQGTPEQPLITVITSTFNAAKDLHWTIESIRAQNYPNIQWIIADGASKDDTVEILKQNEDVIDYWLSEPDSGIYDAWNKVLPYIKGEWVQFLGAGDELADSHTIHSVVSELKQLSESYDLVYGKLMLISPTKRIELEEIDRPWKEIKGQWDGFRPKLPMHPEVFHRRTIFDQENCFGIGYKIAGDSYLLLSNIQKKEPLYIPLKIVRMQNGGISTNIAHLRKALFESKRICKELGIKIPFYVNMSVYFRIIFKLFIFNVLGARFYHEIANFYRKIVGRGKVWGID